MPDISVVDALNIANKWLLEKSRSPGYKAIHPIWVSAHRCWSFSLSWNCFDIEWGSVGYIEISGSTGKILGHSNVETIQEKSAILEKMIPEDYRQASRST